MFTENINVRAYQIVYFVYTNSCMSSFPTPDACIVLNLYHFVLQHASCRTHTLLLQRSD